MVPKAMVGTIVINTIAGLLFLVPVCFVLPDLTMLVNLLSGQPTPVIFKYALGSSVGAFCLMIPLLVLGIICGVGCVTATSRCTWAFARDGGIPGSGWWRVISKKLNIPVNAMMLGMVVEIGLGAIYFGSTAAYNAFSGVGVIFLTMSYACPIAVSLIFRRREDIKNGSVNYSIIGAIANVIALGKFLSVHGWTRLLIANSVEYSCHSFVLYADPQGREPANHELRLSCVRWLCGHRSRVVRRLGLSQLPRSAHRCSRARRRLLARNSRSVRRSAEQSQEPVMLPSRPGCVTRSLVLLAFMPALCGIDALACFPRGKRPVGVLIARPQMYVSIAILFICAIYTTYY